MSKDALFAAYEVPEICAVIIAANDQGSVQRPVGQEQDFSGNSAIVEGSVLAGVFNRDSATSPEQEVATWQNIGIQYMSNGTLA